MTRQLRVRCALVLAAAMVLLAALGTVLLAAPAGKMKEAIVEAEHLVSDVSKNNGKLRITTYTNAEVTQDDSKFSANTVVQQTENNVHTFVCTGNPVFVDPENRITADKVTALSSPRRAEFVGNVKMVSTPKQKSDASGEVKKQLSSEPSTITCDKLSYDYGKKTAVGTGNVVIVQKQRTVWADQATYDQNARLVTLRGNVRMKNAGEEEVKEMTNADTVTVSLENDWIDIRAVPGKKVRWVVEYQEDEAPATGTQK